jgi:hypothetical protein
MQIIPCLDCGNRLEYRIYPSSFAFEPVYKNAYKPNFLSEGAWYNLCCGTCRLRRQNKYKQDALAKYGREVDGWLFTADGFRGMS